MVLVGFFVLVSLLTVWQNVVLLYLLIHFIIVGIQEEEEKTMQKAVQLSFPHIYAILNRNARKTIEREQSCP